MKLRFPESKIDEWANRYSYAGDETELLALRDEVQRTGYLTRAQLKLVARYRLNSDARGGWHKAGNLTDIRRGDATKATDSHGGQGQN
jgi:hypothetical protein